MTSLWRHLSFLQTIVHISNYIEHTNFILGTNKQQHDVQLMISESDLDRRWRSQAKVKGHKTNGHISQTITLTDIIPGAKVQYNKWNLIT